MLLHHRFPFPFFPSLIWPPAVCQLRPENREMMKPDVENSGGGHTYWTLSLTLAPPFLIVINELPLLKIILPYLLVIVFLIGSLYSLFSTVWRAQRDSPGTFSHIWRCCSGSQCSGRKVLICQFFSRCRPLCRLFHFKTQIPLKVEWKADMFCHIKFWYLPCICHSTGNLCEGCDRRRSPSAERHRG